MTFKISTPARNALADAFTALIDAGAGAGKIRIYDGTPPSSPNDALSGNNLLAELALSDPAFGAASAGVATANAISPDASADATGAASFFRALDSNNVVRGQGSVTATGGGGDLQLSNVNIQSGVEVQITSFTLTMPEI